jgi:hypothetical protein
MSVSPSYRYQAIWQSCATIWLPKITVGVKKRRM